MKINLEGLRFPGNDKQFVIGQFTAAPWGGDSEFTDWDTLHLTLDLQSLWAHILTVRLDSLLRVR